MTSKYMLDIWQLLSFIDNYRPRHGRFLTLFLFHDRRYHWAVA